MDGMIDDRPLEALACKIETEIGGPTGKTIRLVPDGEVESKHGTFIMDREAARAIIAEFVEHNTLLPIDWEHQTLGGEYASPSGRAPAAGWIQKIWYERGRGLMALVNWNAEAVEDIRSKKYLYLSPVVMVRKTDRRAVALHSAALVNKPAIVGMDRLAASDRLLEKETTAMAEDPADRSTKEPAEKQGMDQIKELLTKLKELLGGKGTSAADILKEAILVIQGEKTADDLAETESVAGSMARVTDRHAATLEASIAQSQELATMKAAEVDRVVSERLQPYIDKAVLIETWPVQMEAARHLAQYDPERFAALMHMATPCVPQGRTTPPSQGSTRCGGVISEARRVFESDAMTRKLTSEQAFVNRTLADANLEKLTDEEFTAYSIAKPVD